MTNSIDRRDAVTGPTGMRWEDLARSAQDREQWCICIFGDLVYNCAIVPLPQMGLITRTPCHEAHNSGSLHEQCHVITGVPTDNVINAR